MKRILGSLVLLAVMAAWAAPAGADPATFDRGVSAYREYVQTLWHLTDKADKAADHTSPEYLELYTQGHFFKDRTSASYAALKKEIKANPEETLARLKGRVAQDTTGREYDTLKKLIGYNIRVLKAKDPSLDVSSLLPRRPGAVAAPESTGMFLSLEESAGPTAVAPDKPSAWAMQEFERVFAPLPGAAARPTFGAYQEGPEAVPQQADGVKTGWVSSQFATREGNEVLIKASEMNVRGGPSTDHAVVGKARNGQRLPFVSERDGWYEVRLPAGTSPAAPPAGGGSYCKISIVKGNVPYLVQMDSFLGPKEVVLTFDDGPTTKDDRTAGVIRDLKAQAMPAIYFMLGSTLQSAALQPLVKLCRQNGGYPAVHGYYHATSDGKPFTALPWETVRKHLVDTKSAIRSLTGEEAVFFRPPYGIIRADDLRKIESELQLIPVGWTIDSMDWSIKSPDELFTKVTSMIKARGKGIVLMHDIHPQSRAVVPRLAAWLKANGYTVVGPERLVDGFRAAR